MHFPQGIKAAPLWRDIRVIGDALCGSPKNSDVSKPPSCMGKQISNQAEAMAELSEVLSDLRNGEDSEDGAGVENDHQPPISSHQLDLILKAAEQTRQLLGAAAPEQAAQVRQSHSVPASLKRSALRMTAIVVLPRTGPCRNLPDSQIAENSAERRPPFPDADSMSNGSYSFARSLPGWRSRQASRCWR